jgi:putative ABC transport system ATP-binding protein
MKRNIVFRDGRIQKESLVTDRFNATQLIEALPVEEDYES